MNVTPVVTGLDHVWDIGFTPDGTMLYTERPGRISAFVGGQKRVLAAPSDVLATYEAGVMGMAIDPSFATTRAIYVCMASTLPAAGNDVRLVRWVVNADYTALTNRVDVVTGAPVNAAAEVGRHAGCRPRFGPDGNIWIGTGDAATGSVAQNPSSLGGKVLRVDRLGQGAAGNLGGGHDPRIFSTGHRNLQGIAFRSDGLGVSLEHGTDRDDELNHLVKGNFGWDPRHPSNPSIYNEAVPMTDRAKFPTAIGALVSSGTETYAPSGATFVSGSRWGSWNGALVVATLKGRTLRVFKLAPLTGQLLDGGFALPNYARMRSVTQGPDGNLYVGTSNGGNGDRILRLSPR